MSCGKLVTVCVMVRIYTSVRVRLLQCGTEVVKRITDFKDIATDRVERLPSALVLCEDQLAV
jgi:hypothetical protein